MADNAPDGNAEQPRIILQLLDSVDRDGTLSQRRLAAELGIALGLVNAYIRRCVKKGLLKAREAPARRYVYYLTPKGFAEKSRLTVEYLAGSFGFFRQARQDCTSVLLRAQALGYSKIALAGKSDLAEIVAICALDGGIEIIGIVDGHAEGQRFVGLPLFTGFDTLVSSKGEPDAVVITDLTTTRDSCEQVIERFGSDRTLVPELLRMRLDRQLREDA